MLIESPRASTSSPSIAEIKEIRQKIPDGLEVKKTVYGYGVFASKAFPKGSTLYTGKQIVIPNEFAEFNLVIENTDQSFILDTETHSVEFSKEHRWLYLFDSFMNHSCEPTSMTVQTDLQFEMNQYDTVAMVDITPGTEVTCDYNLFEYDSHGKDIEKCLCGSKGCIGRVAGFKYLTIPQKKARLANVERMVLETMSGDQDNKFLYIPDLRCPLDRVTVEYTDFSGYKLVAQRDFEEGEMVYTNESLIFPAETDIVFEVNGERKWVDKLIHTVNIGKGQRVFYYFDSFQNHSCEPNTFTTYRSGNHYEMTATRAIKAGEEITSDYESFDEGLDGTSFICNCGTAKCRGVIKA